MVALGAKGRSVATSPRFAWRPAHGLEFGTRVTRGGWREQEAEGLRKEAQKLRDEVRQTRADKDQAQAASARATEEVKARAAKAVADAQVP